MPLAGELLTELLIVLNYAIVNDGYCAGSRTMWVGIG